MQVQSLFYVFFALFSTDLINLSSIKNIVNNANFDIGLANLVLFTHRIAHCVVDSFFADFDK